jgi:hypothetical protein
MPEIGCSIALLLLQLRVFDFRLLIDGDVGVDVFPECKVVLISGAGLCGITLQNVRAGLVEDAATNSANATTEAKVLKSPA